ncbi:tetrapyrrole methylase family protein/MazG family protein [Alicyclobacillus sacchari]|uniref:Tetrapyrrole methylase family protein/MazG family protein n=1 Tax=Alicyclobacillus sacchari TaxID=392010 RepID=A0A4R8LLZ2_9BACL|nr:tetrapyrrole methylase family protein/MazG family protein [Alicyclobacillus sacchari]
MGIVHVVGLGPGDVDGLPVGTYRLLQSGWPVILRTAVHPVVASLPELGVEYESLDDIYETSETFDEAYARMAKRVRERAKTHDHVIYAVPGHPLIAELSVQLLLTTTDSDVVIEIGPGQSFLDVAASRLRIDPIEGLLLLDGTQPASRLLNPRVHTLIAQVYQRQVATDVKLSLMDVYPDDYQVTVVRAAGVAGEERLETVPLYELDRLDWIDHLTTVYVPPVQDAQLTWRDPFAAVEIVETLRGPDGCPWDRKQTHESLRKYVIEEAYEVAAAIDERDPDHLAEELGDLLLQVLLHAQIASEVGDFDVRDVFARLSEKLVRRHPHVFGEGTAQSVDEVNAIWERVKEEEHAKQESRQSTLAAVSFAGPALMVAQAVQTAAAKVGFDWTKLEDVWGKIKEEMNELEIELVRDRRRDAAVAEELGDLLFACVNVARFLQLDAETLLAEATRKFIHRFQYVERRVAEGNESWAEISPETLDSYWNEAKITLPREN